MLSIYEKTVCKSNWMRGSCYDDEDYPLISDISRDKIYTLLQENLEKILYQDDIITPELKYS